jgi:hypothetical protein
MEDVIEYLEVNGYKEDKYMIDNNNTRYFYKRIEGPDCKCNKKPPFIGVTVYSHKEHKAVEMSLKAETAMGQWVDLKYYAMNINEIYKVNMYERYIVTMWEVANLTVYSNTK